MNGSVGPSGGIVAGLVLFYGFFILLALASFVFWIVELIDVARREFRDSNTKLVWLLVVVLAHGLGALIYYFAGRSQGWLPGETPLYPPNPASQYSSQDQWPPAPGLRFGPPPDPQNPYSQPPNSQPPPENRQE
ncbi:MAG: PLDc N-terminal domain-containing protein [Armatimonadota bacterium]|nr:PLDc N-terminal domain-containing protein [Armatimonadota bacterium]